MVDNSVSACCQGCKSDIPCLIFTGNRAHTEEAWMWTTHQRHWARKDQIQNTSK